MNQIFGKATYSLDVDGEVFKIPKKRKSRLGRVATEVVHTLFGLTYQANAPPKRVIEYSVTSSENPTDASVWQSRKGAVVTSPPPAPIRQAQGRLSRGRSAAATTLSDDKIKSERVRRLRDRIVGRE